MAETSIEWTSGPNGEPGYSFNPWVGCQRVSPGCEHCYAEAYDKRVGGAVDPADPFKPSGEDLKKLRWGPKAPRVRTAPANWRKPLKWNRDAAAAGQRRKVFCASLADVFEDRAELAPWRFDLFTLIQATPNLDWLLLTKRPENIAALWPNGDVEGPGTTGEARAARPPLPPPGAQHWPNVWLGTTAENQEQADRRVELMSKVPAVIRFVSVEPMLEFVNPIACSHCGYKRSDQAAHGDHHLCRGVLPQVDWVICGGESGPGARSFDVEWARFLRDQCAEAGVAFFFKQLGVHTRMSPDGGDPLPMFFRQGTIGDPACWPEDLRVRQFPEVKHV